MQETDKRLSRHGCALLFFLATAGLSATPALAADCSRFGATVSLAGVFVSGVLSVTASGADPLSLAGRTADLLILDIPLCVMGDAVSRGVAAAANVQLVCPGVDVESGQATTLTGRLVGAHTGNGHTPVLLVCAV